MDASSSEYRWSSVKQWAHTGTRIWAIWPWLGQVPTDLKKNPICYRPESPDTLQYRRRGSRSSSLPVFTWRPCISSRRSSGMERVTAHCQLLAVPRFILAISESISVPATTVSIALITVSWSWSACTQHHVNPGELNWTEPNPFCHPSNSVKALLYCTKNIDMYRLIPCLCGCA